MRPALDGTTELLHRMKRGDRGALEALFRRLLPRLARFTSRRLPREARDAADTADIVQDTLLRSLGPLQQMEPRGTGAVHAYLRQAAMNRIRDEIRRARRAPRRAELPDLPSADSPLRQAITNEEAARYARGLDRLSPSDRRAVEGRLTEGLDYEQLAGVLGKPSAGAARIAVTRALVRLAREMHRDSSR
jgi:RNA polymerase sigma factor (sigma-70 family)